MKSGLLFTAVHWHTYVLKISDLRHYFNRSSFFWWFVFFWKSRLFTNYWNESKLIKILHFILFLKKSMKFFVMLLHDQILFAYMNMNKQNIQIWKLTFWWNRFFRLTLKVWWALSFEALCFRKCLRMKLNCVKLKSDPFIIPFDFQFLDVVICSRSSWIRMNQNVKFRCTNSSKNTKRCNDMSMNLDIFWNVELIWNINYMIFRFGF